MNDVEMKESSNGAAEQRDPKVEAQLEQLLRYWQQCYEPQVDKLSRSGSSTETHVVEDEEESDDNNELEVVFDEELSEVEDEFRYVHFSRRTEYMHHDHHYHHHHDEVSGLPLVCGNCGVSFFSLRCSEDNDGDFYCSGECKWSVIMYREMERRSTMSMQQVPVRSSYASSYGQESDCFSVRSASCQYMDDGVSCR